MTKEEAIEYLNRLYMQAEITDEYGNMDDTEPYETAIDMAVEALSDVPKDALTEPINPCTICQEFDCTGCKFRRTRNDK